MAQYATSAVEPEVCPRRPSGALEEARYVGGGDAVEPGDLGDGQAVFEPGPDAGEIRRRDLGRRLPLRGDRRGSRFVRDRLTGQSSEDARPARLLFGGVLGRRSRRCGGRIGLALWCEERLGGLSGIAGLCAVVAVWAAGPWARVAEAVCVMILEHMALLNSRDLRYVGALRAGVKRSQAPPHHAARHFHTVQ